MRGEDLTATSSEKTKFTCFTKVNGYCIQLYSCRERERELYSFMELYSYIYGINVEPQAFCATIYAAKGALISSWSNIHIQIQPQKTISCISKRPCDFCGSCYAHNDHRLDQALKGCENMYSFCDDG